MKWTSRIALVLAVLVMMPAAVLAKGKSEQPDGIVDLTFWHIWGGSRTPLIEQMIADFQADNPNIRIEAAFTPPNEMITKIMQAAGTATLPDVFSMHSSWYINLQPEETLLSLDSLLRQGGINLEEVLVPAEAQRSYWQGSVYSLPNVNAGAQILFFYNRDLIEQAGLDPESDLPTNWNEMVEVSKTLVEKLNTTDKLDIIAWDPFLEAGQLMVQTFSYGAGHPTVSADGTKSLLSSDGVIDTVKKFDQYVQDIYGKYGGYRSLMEWSSRTAGLDTGAAVVQPFLQGKAVFYVSGSWTIAQLDSGNPDLDYGIMPVPGFNGPQGGTAKDGWSYAISADTEHEVAAWKFLKFIALDPQGAGVFTIAQMRPSPIRSVNEAPELTAMGDTWTNLVRTMNMDIVPDGNIFMSTIKPWIHDIPSQRISGVSVEKIMLDMDDRFQDYLDDINN